MTNFDIKQFILEKSKQAGFEQIGFAKAKYLQKYEQYFLTWLENGYHAQMQYMAKEPHKRLDVRLLLNSAKTVVVFVKNYNTQAQQCQSNYKISKYAFFDDYHILIKKNISHIATELENKVENLEYRIFVDSAPLLEKALAVEAGLGWWGKNSLVLTKNGSFFFIGILLLNIEIEDDNKILADYCGKCTKCIDACPTKAIVSPRVVDSNSCISYLTIEKKEDFDPKMDYDFKNWVFGCDICQEVCPWNRKSVFSKDPNLKPYEQIINFSPFDWENLTQNEFNAIFKKSAIKRTKYNGLMRNVNYVKQNLLKD